MPRKNSHSDPNGNKDPSYFGKRAKNDQRAAHQMKDEDLVVDFGDLKRSVHEDLLDALGRSESYLRDFKFYGGPIEDEPVYHKRWVDDPSHPQGGYYEVVQGPEPVTGKSKIPMGDFTAKGSSNPEFNAEELRRFFDEGVGDFLQPYQRELFDKIMKMSKEERYRFMYGGIPDDRRPRAPAPPDDVEITEETARTVLGRFVARYGPEKTLRAMEIVLEEMGDLPSILMVMRQKFMENEPRWDRGEPYRW